VRRLKKYVVFIFSLVLLYIVFQILSGWLLTALYTPDISSINNNVSQEVEFGQNSIIPFWVTLLTATLAYFLSQKIFKGSKS
jgi:quinol-cytochrome oxidoreductase complex cytochrome b subunit